MGVTLSGLSLRPAKSAEGGSECSPSRQWPLLTDPATGTSYSSQLSGPVSGLHGHHGDAFCHAQWSAGVPYFCGSVGSGSRLSVDTTATPFLGFWESGPPGAPVSEDLVVLPSPAPGSLLLPPPLQDSQIISLCLDFYRKKLFAGNFSFGPISVLQR